MKLLIVSNLSGPSGSVFNLFRVPQFNYPQVWSIGALALDQISQFLHNHRDGEGIREINRDLDELITHPLFWSTIDFAHHLTYPEQNQVRSALDRLLSPFLSQPTLLLAPLYIGSIYSLFISSSSLSDDFGKWIEISPNQIDLQNPQNWPLLYKLLYLTHLMTERTQSRIWPRFIEKAFTSTSLQWTLTPHFKTDFYQVEEYTSPFLIIISSLLPLIYPQPDLNPTWQKVWTAQDYQDALFSLSHWISHPQHGLVQALKMMQKRVP